MGGGAAGGLWRRQQWSPSWLPSCILQRIRMKNMQFHSKMAWPPATYDVVSGSHSNRPSLNFSLKMRARDEPIATENVR